MSPVTHRHPIFSRAGFLGRIFLLVIIASLCLTQTATAQITPDALPGSTRLSGPAATDGPVVDYKISPTGQYAVYKTYKPGAAPDTGTPGLYSVALNGGQPVSLSAPLPPGNSANTTYQISSTGARVVYAAFQNSSTYRSLYTIPITGETAATRLSLAGHNVTNYLIAPSGQWIVFFTADSSNKSHIYRVDISGSYTNAEEIIIPGATNLWLTSLKITPDSKYILFLGQLSTTTNWGIYSIPLTGTGSQAVRLTRLMNSNYMLDFEVTPDAQNIIYKYVYQVGGTLNYSLYRVPITGPADDDIMVSGPADPLIPIPNGAQIPAFKISPDSRWVVFVADNEILGRQELFSTRLVQRQAVYTVNKLNVVLPGTQDVFADSYAISPDNSKVVYLANHTHYYDMFIVPINGPIAANLRLNNPKPPADLYFQNFALLFTPDSQRLVYTASQDMYDLPELYSIPVGGSPATSVKLNPYFSPMTSADQVQTPLLSPDGTTVFFTIPPVNGSGRRVLYNVPLTGPENAARPLTPAIDKVAATSPALVPNSSMIAYLQTTNYANAELFVVGYGAVYLPYVSR